MPDRVGSDHPTVTTLRGRLARRGGTRRPAVEVPDAGDALPTEGTVRLVVDGRTRHAPIVEQGGAPTIVGAYDNARLARERRGDDRLAAWVAANDVAMGRSVLVDVVEAGAVYGLRLPGETSVYEVERGPADSLRRIAEGLDP